MLEHCKILTFVKVFFFSVHNIKQDLSGILSSLGLTVITIEIFRHICGICPQILCRILFVNSAIKNTLLVQIFEVMYTNYSHKVYTVPGLLY